MIVSAWNPSVEELEKTFLSSYLAAANSVLTVPNANRFAVNKMILIGNMGFEQSEIKQTHASTAPTATTITLASNTTYPHNADDPVYLLRYDQVLFYRASSADGSYTLIATEAVDVDNKEGKTYYEDLSGSSTSYYKTKFRNSISLEETEFSDYISATGPAADSIGSVVNTTVSRIKDPGFSILTVEDYIALAQEVGDELISQSARPYAFLKSVVMLDRVADQAYVDLPDDYEKYDYVIAHNQVGGMLSQKNLSLIPYKQFKSGYGMTVKSDVPSRIALDDANRRLLVSPTPRTNLADVWELHYYSKFRRITDLSNIVQTPNSLIYKYKFLSEAYKVKAERDPSFMTLAKDYESKYGAEIMKLQRMNQKDAGGGKSFNDANNTSSINNSPARRRYVL